MEMVRRMQSEAEAAAAEEAELQEALVRATAARLETDACLAALQATLNESALPPWSGVEGPDATVPMEDQD